MSEELKNTVVSRFLDFYRSDLEAEVIDDKSVVLSFPVHFSGFHRIEVTVTQGTSGRFILSDGSKTISELRNAGYALNKRLKNRLEFISRMAKLRVVNNYLVSECDAQGLGSEVQRFVEAVKTIGDAYLVQRLLPSRETNLLNRVAEFLGNQQVVYRTRYLLDGELEKHTVDFYLPPNGVPGLALSVMGNPSRTAAEAWAFRSSDIRRVNDRTDVGVVYDDTIAKENSKAILTSVADISVPSSDLSVLRARMQSLGIAKNSPVVSAAIFGQSHGRTFRKGDE